MLNPAVAAGRNDSGSALLALALALPRRDGLRSQVSAAHAHVGDFAPKPVDQLQSVVHAGVGHLHHAVGTAYVVVVNETCDPDRDLTIAAETAASGSCGNLHDGTCK